jgi:hypothetical protein
MLLEALLFKSVHPRAERKQQGKAAPPPSLCRLPQQHATLQTLYEHLKPSTPTRTSNHTNAQHARHSNPVPLHNCTTVTARILI